MKFKYFFVLSFLVIAACSSKNDSVDAISEATPVPWVEVAMRDSVTLQKRVLVVSYSPDNAGKTLAKNIAKPFGADVEVLVDKKKRSGCCGYFIAGKDASFGALTEIDSIKYDPSKYDMVIIGTPIWAWDMSPAVRTYITQNRDKLKNVSFYTFSGATGPDKIVKKLEELSKVESQSSTGFTVDDFKDKSRYSKILISFIDSVSSKL